MAVEIRHEGDCERIRSVVSAKRGAAITLEQAQSIWEDYSDMYAAGWLFLPEDDAEILRVWDNSACKRAADADEESDKEFESFWLAFDHHRESHSGDFESVARRAFKAGFKAGRGPESEWC